MTKAERIRELYKTGEYTTRQIADVIGCETSYVRVVARQRVGGGLSEIDHRYLAKPGVKASIAKREREYHSKRWREDPEYRERRNEIKRRSAAKRRAEAHAS